RLRVSLILALHREALTGLSLYAGNFRPAGVEIEGSKHHPVGSHLVPELVEDLCDYVNENWHQKSAIHLASYVMWRLNWIHPFSDGNGRTSRILSYVVLCIRYGELLSGTKTIPEFITENRNPYFEALEGADAAYENKIVNVSLMENLMEELLAAQMYTIIENATANNIDKNK
ncbi:MAG: Fic family protein, partial [Rhodospirillaceae bacterium]|nr:Fic family protein [Rhodospirillaceae bacterium]